MSCTHKRAHRGLFEVACLEDDKFHLSLSVLCEDCKEKFVFLGLPAGMNLLGPTVSFDGTEARLAIAPVNSHRVNAQGFTIN